MIIRLVLLSLSIFAAMATVFSQGGKAEPKRIEFAAGKSSAIVTGTLRNGQEMEYIFGANKGQTVTIKNSNKSLFDFYVSSDEVSFAPVESSPILSLPVPETGDYLLSVRKKQVKTPRSARFSLTLTIK